jgi:hypothetical protein
MVYTPAGWLTTDSFNTNSRQNGSFDQHKLGVWTDKFPQEAILKLSPAVN